MYRQKYISFSRNHRWLRCFENELIGSKCDAFISLNSHSIFEKAGNWEKYQEYPYISWKRRVFSQNNLGNKQNYGKNIPSLRIASLTFLSEKFQSRLKTKERKKDRASLSLLNPGLATQSCVTICKILWAWLNIFPGSTFQLSSNCLGSEKNSQNKCLLFAPHIV